MSSRVIHFEVPADDPERCAQFYADAFGWTIQKWGGPTDYWLVTTGESPGRRLILRHRGLAIGRRVVSPG